MAVRLPLQTGASALRDCVGTTIVASLIVWLAVGVMIGGVVGGFTGGSASIVLGAPFIAVFISFAAIGSWIGGLVSARMHRASDLELDADGFTIRGGRKDGFFVTFAELKPYAVTIEDAVSGAVRRYSGQTKYKRAVFIKAQGDIHLIAETAEDDEEASVRGLMEAIEERLEPSTPPKKRPDLVVLCTGCGAPVTPVDADETTCKHCSAKTPMPAEVRKRIEAGAAHAHLETAVAKVLAQPGATGINVLLAVVMAVVSVSGLLGPIALIYAPRIGMALVALALTMFFVARARIDGRRALRDVTLGFAAKTDKAGASCCRVCTGGLPAGENVVVRCVYCDAMNVRGLDFGRGGASKATLEEELARRASTARLAWIFAAISAAITVACVLALVIR
jgi:hypothetical protein